MRSWRNSGLILEEAECWIDMELHNHEREMKSEVAADLRLQRKKEKKSAQVAARARVVRSLRKNLLSLIVAYLSVREKRHVR
jgi:hypothetical protein